MNGTSYLVTDFGEYMDVLENGKIVSATATAEKAGIITASIYRCDDRIYSLSTVNKEERVYMVRLA